MSHPLTVYYPSLFLKENTRALSFNTTTSNGKLACKLANIVTHDQVLSLLRHATTSRDFGANGIVWFLDLRLWLRYQLGAFCDLCCQFYLSYVHGCDFDSASSGGSHHILQIRFLLPASLVTSYEQLDSVLVTLALGQCKGFPSASCTLHPAWLSIRTQCRGV